MNSMRHNSRRGRSAVVGFTLSAIVVTSLTLAGCADSVSTGTTLLTTKSSTQLLMAEAASRVPAYMVVGEPSYDDLSEACGKEGENVEGLIRLWRSSATFSLKDNASIDPDTIIAEIVASFVDEGWVTTSSGGSTELTKSSVPTTLRFTATPLETGTGGTLVVAARGACVPTDGPDSDEVVDLERSSR